MCLRLRQHDLACHAWALAACDVLLAAGLLHARLCPTSPPIPASTTLQCATSGALFLSPCLQLDHRRPTHKSVCLDPATHLNCI